MNTQHIVELTNAASSDELLDGFAPIYDALPKIAELIAKAINILAEDGKVAAAIAHASRHFHEAYLAVGFTEEQAFQLTLRAMDAMRSAAHK